MGCSSEMLRVPMKPFWVAIASGEYAFGVVSAGLINWWTPPLIAPIVPNKAFNHA